MKHIYTILFILLVLSGSAAAQDYSGKVTVTDRQLDKDNSSLSLSMNILIKAGAVERCQSLTVMPEVVLGGQTQAFPYVLVNGVNQDRMYNRHLKLRSSDAGNNDPYRRVRISGGADTLVHYSATVPYQPWMETATLYVNCELSSCNDDPELFALSEDKLDFRPAEPYQPQPQVTWAEPAREQKFRNVQSQAYLDFQVNKSVILPDFRNNPAELKKIDDAIEKLRGSEGADEVNITGLFIEGYASPEGPYVNNERLSRERTMALKNYIKSKYSFPETMLKTSSVTEDWDGLARLVRESGARYSDDILAIINNTSDPDLREKKIRELAGGAAYRELASEILPKLRRVEARVDFSVRDYSEREVKDLYSNRENLEWLSAYELWRLAFEYEKGTDKFNEIMDVAIKLYPDDPAVNINAGAAMIARGDLNAAKGCLEKVKDDPRAYNNLGALYLLSGDLDRAKELLRKAAANGCPEAEHNLRELEMSK